MSPSDPRDPDDRNPPAAEPVDDDVQTELIGPDGVIDLGDLASVDDGGSMSIPLANLPDPPSGQSLTSWTEVIRRQRAAAETAPKAAEPVVDAPSDQDLLSRIDDRQPGDTSEIPAGEIPVVNPRSASEIDLGSSPWGPPGSGPTSSSEVGFPVMAPPSDAGGAMRPPIVSDYAPLTEADFAEAAGDVPFAAEAEPVGDSFAGLGDSPPDGPGGERSSILDVLVSDSRDTGTRPPSASDILAYGQAPAMPRRPSSHETVPPPPPPSGWLIDEVPGDDQGELIPESRTGTDAVVDLYAEAHRPPSLTDSGSLEISDEAIEEARRRSDLAESSSVDLSSRPGLVESNFDLALQSGADIDLGLPARAPDASSSMVYPAGVRENQAALEAEFAQRRRQTDGAPEPIRPARLTEVRSSGSQYMLRGTVLGFLIASGAALMAYFGGLVPNSSPVTAAAGTTPDNSAEVARLKKDLDAAKTELAEAKTKGADPAELAAAKQATADAQAAADAAKKEKADLVKSYSEEKGNLLTALEEERANVKNGLRAVETLRAQAKAFKDAGVDPDKPADAIKALVTAKTEAEAKEKETAAKVTEAEKKVVDANKLAETAKKSADEALAAATEAKKAQEASAATLTTLADRLTKAKFVGEKPDGPALVKGVEDALKAASTDATAALRDELAKSREAETKAKTDLTAATTKATDAAKAADAAKAEATKLADLAKAAESKAATEAEKAEKLAKDLAAANKGVDEKVAAATKAADEKADKLTKDLAAATKAADERVATALKDVQDKAAVAVKAAQEKAAIEAAALKADAEKAAKVAADAMKAATEAKAEAEKVAADAKAAQAKVAADAAKLKTENERLARELETVKDIAAAIKSPGSTMTGPAVKPDVSKIADRHYGEAVANLNRGRTLEAESGFRKAITFQPDDARFHYLLGVALWSNGNQKEAEEEFKKGQELELAGRPDRRAVSLALERVQGAARQAVNAHRP